MTGNLLKDASSDAASSWYEKGGDLGVAVKLVDDDDDDNDGWWWYQERLPAPDVHEEDKEDGGGQLRYGDRDEAVMNIIQLAVMILSTIK